MGQADGESPERKASSQIGSSFSEARDAVANFVRMHKMLGMAHTMAANITDRLWAVEQLIETISEQQTATFRASWLIMD